MGQTEVDESRKGDKSDCSKLNSEGWNKFQLNDNKFYYVNIGKALAATPVRKSSLKDVETVMDLVAEKVAVWVLNTEDIYSDDDSDDDGQYEPESLETELKKNEDAIMELDDYEWSDESEGGLQIEDGHFYWIAPQGRYDVPLTRLVEEPASSSATLSSFDESYAAGHVPLLIGSVVLMVASLVALRLRLCGRLASAEGAQADICQAPEAEGLLRASQ